MPPNLNDLSTIVAIGAGIGGPIVTMFYFFLRASFTPRTYTESIERRVSEIEGKLDDLVTHRDLDKVRAEVSELRSKDIAEVRVTLATVSATLAALQKSTDAIAAAMAGINTYLRENK